MRNSVITLPAASKVLLNTGGCLVVHTTRETSGTTAAVYRLWDGVNNAGQLLLPVSLVAAESTRDDFHAHHLTFRTGLYFELVSGACEGSVAVLTDHDCHKALAAVIDITLGG